MIREYPKNTLKYLTIFSCNANDTQIFSEIHQFDTPQ